MVLISTSSEHLKGTKSCFYTTSSSSSLSINSTLSQLALPLSRHDMSIGLFVAEWTCKSASLLALRFWQFENTRFFAISVTRSSFLTTIAMAHGKTKLFGKTKHGTEIHPYEEVSGVRDGRKALAERRSTMPHYVDIAPSERALSATPTP